MIRPSLRRWLRSLRSLFRGRKPAAKPIKGFTVSDPEFDAMLQRMAQVESVPRDLSERIAADMDAQILRDLYSEDEKPHVVRW